MRYRLAAAFAVALVIYVTIFARSTTNFIDLPTWIDVTEWPISLIFAATAWFAWFERGKIAAALSVVGLLGFFAAQSQHFFDVPLGFLFVTIVTLGILLTMPSSDAGR